MAIGAALLTGVFIGVLGASSPAAPPDVGPRIAAAMTAEQHLQGPLDGAWVLRDAAGRPLYCFEIVDPVGGLGPVTGAWRDGRGVARGVRTGFIAWIRRAGRTLRLDFAPAGRPAVTLRLRGRSPGVWTGWMTEGGVRRAVVLRRG